MTSPDAWAELRDLIFGMQEVPDPDGVWDYEGRIRALTPGPEVDLRVFVDERLEGLWEMHLGTVLRIFAEKGHRELIPHMHRLLQDTSSMIRLDGAMALLLCGADGSEETFVEVAATSDRYDVRDILAEYSAHIPAHVRSKLLP